jgi:hypothetical protein
MPTRIRLYVLSIVAAALIAAGLVLRISPAHPHAAVVAVLCLGLFAVLSELLPHHLSSGAAGSISFIPHLASALLVPGWLAVLGVACSHLIAAILSKKDPFRLLFNVAQITLATAIGILVYLALGGQPFLNVTDPFSQAAARYVVPFLALVISFFCVNTLAVSGAIAVSQSRSLTSVFRQHVRASILNDIMSSPVVYLLAWVYTRFGIWGVALLTLPLLGVRQLYKTNHQLEQVNRELLELMVKAIEARDPYTSGHSRRVSHYSTLIARAIGLTAKQVERIGIAALLHDVGKIHEIYAPILRKPDKLTPDEWAIMQTHPIKSAELVATVSHLKDLVAPVRGHHENWDGSGYPDGLSGEGIPLASRVILFADTIDAMTTDRPYRKALTEAQVRAELLKFRGTQFDPNLCDQLLGSPMFGLLFSPAAARESSPARGVRIGLVRPA